MAQVRSRRIFWTPPQATDVVSYRVYVSGFDDPAFLADIDAGNASPFQSVAEPELIIDENIGLAEGRYQFAVTALDDAGNESDPHQPDAWKDVEIDVTPPDPPVGGGIEFVS